MLYCSSNKDRCTCTESESVYIEHLDRIIPILVNKLKANEPELRKRLAEVFSDKETDNSLKEEIDKINGQIIFLNKKVRGILFLIRRRHGNSQKRDKKRNCQAN